MFTGRPYVTVSMERDNINWAKGRGLPGVELATPLHKQRKSPNPLPERLIGSCVSASLPGNWKTMVQMQEIVLHLPHTHRFTKLNVILQS